ncbi:major facilitator superfamily domain-containing protein [Amanita rubescens]|nr:major facilitator superfamily domain-containing protein [Amanita rubescens]
MCQYHDGLDVGRRPRTGTSHYSRLSKLKKSRLIPVILIANIARGVTTAPRIHVYLAIACSALEDTSMTQPVPNMHMLQSCTSPEVAARAANIQAAVVTMTSILSTVTTGFWSRFGETYGRKPLFIVFLIGTIFMEFVFVFVRWPNAMVRRYAEQLLLIGPIVEGLVGSYPTFGGAIHAYISDCTPHGSRSKTFSMIQGIVYIGLAAGPWLTGLILPQTSTTNIFFYISMSLHAFTVAYMLLLCPESRERETPIEVSPHVNNEPSKASTLDSARSLTLKFLTAIISPIVMFAPRPLLGYPERKSYSLTFVGAALFMCLISNGIYTTKYLFAQHLYSWTTAELGNYMALLWIIKAINLLVILPIIISWLKPKPSTATTLQPRELAQELQFDRYLAQASLLLDGTSDLLVALTSARSQVIFIALSCISSFTSGAGPALHSLGAVCLHACGYSSEIGVLFGATAVLSAVAHIFAPYIFSTTYATTVAYFPQAIFLLTTSLIYTAIILLAFVRPSLKDIELVHATRAAEEESSSRLLPQEEEIDEETE